MRKDETKQEIANNNSDIEELYALSGNLERKITILGQEISNENISDDDASAKQGESHLLKVRLQDVKRQLGALKANRNHKRRI